MQTPDILLQQAIVMKDDAMAMARRLRDGAFCHRGAVAPQLADLSREQIEAFTLELCDYASGCEIELATRAAFMFTNFHAVVLAHRALQCRETRTLATEVLKTAIAHPPAVRQLTFPALHGNIVPFTGGGGLSNA